MCWLRGISVDTTIVRHSKYGLCTVGGFDRKNQTLSLHDYRTNKRLTQGAKVIPSRMPGELYVLATVAESHVFRLTASGFFCDVRLREVSS